MLSEHIVDLHLDEQLLLTKNLAKTFENYQMSPFSKKCKFGHLTTDKSYKGKKHCRFFSTKTTSINASLMERV